MTSRWLVDGESQLVDPLDRGLAYGDGVFETMALRDRRIQLFGFHCDRFEHSIQRLGFAPPSRADVIGDIATLLADDNNGVVKLIFTRGSSERGYRPPQQASPRRIVIMSAYPDIAIENYRDGVDVIGCMTPHSANPALAGMKHLCRLEQVLAQREIADAGAAEGIMSSPQGTIISGSMSNLFLVVDGQLVTPELSLCGVAGVMRRATITAAQDIGIGIREATIERQQLEQADALFLTNSVFGIWPIRSFAGQIFEMHEVTRRLMTYLGVQSTGASSSFPLWMRREAQSWN